MLSRRLRELYFFLSFFACASALITIFEPVFFYQQGFSLTEISLYYALHYIIYVLIMPFGAQVANRFGYERSLALSAPVAVVYLLLLSRLPSYPALFWITPLVLAVHKMFYWTAYHATFIAFGDRHNLGTEQSWVRLITFSAGIVGPLVGGFVVATFGFPTLFIIAAGLSLIACASLLRTRERYAVARLPYGIAWQVMQRVQYRRLTWAMIGWAEDLIHLVFWPIFLMTMLGRVESLGIAVAVSVAAATAWGFVIGELSDDHSPRTVLRWSALAVVASWGMRLVVQTPLQAAGADMGGRLADTSMEIPFLALLYRPGTRINPLVYTLTFETILACAKAVTALFLAGIFFVLPVGQAFIVAFSIAALAAFLYRAL